MWISNLLVAERVGEDAFVGKNAGQTRHPGIEIALSKNFYFSNNNRWKLQTNYQYAPHRFQEFTDNDVDLSGKTLPGNPAHKWNTTVSYNADKIYSNISHQLVGQTFANDQNNITVDGYQLLDAVVGIRLLNDNRNWNLSLEGTVQNILDANYASMIAVNPRSFGSNLPRYLYPGLPRNYIIRVKAGYNWR